MNTWRMARAQGRTPHALMLTGATGTGKRNAAAHIARQHLGMPEQAAVPLYPLRIPEHADMRWVSTPSDKHVIGIDRIRELVGELALTSYEGGGKVAVIEPADVMTTSAANSLLKTLEEPPGDTLLILVVDRPGRLPATVVSRCQRLHLRPPAFNEGLAWLTNAHVGGSDLAVLLKASGDAPLAALLAADRLDDTKTMAADFRAIAGGDSGPLAVAARWAKFEPEFVLGWLGRQIQLCIRTACTGNTDAGQAALSQSVLDRIDTRNMFCYLDIINKLRGQPPRSYNVLLTLESLLIDWSQGLKFVTDAHSRIR